MRMLDSDYKMRVTIVRVVDTFQTNPTWEEKSDKYWK